MSMISRNKRILSYWSIATYGGGKTSTPTVIPATPPPAPPAEEATMTEFTDEEQNKKKRTAISQGAKSLQIPLGGTTGATVGTA